MSGFDVARAVRERSSTVPVIMMSGYVRPEDRDRALALGVREVLLKPATVEELCQSIDRQLH
jgi:CheY-like chemotaxis protein